jgi:hypothetical protein
MYCLNCGAAIPEGSAFCVACGAKVEPPPSSPYGQPPYGQSYGQPPYGQPPYHAQPPQPPKKGKPKTWIFIAGGAALLLAIAAVLLFVVFKVGGGSASGGDGDLFSSGTMQAKFFNDGAKVFRNAFSDLGVVDFSRMGSEPFNVDMDYSIEVSGFPMTMSLAAAYDEENLGASASVMGQDVTVLLDGDTLYTSMGGEVQGYRFNSDEDLSKPMSLNKRFKALMEGLGSGGNSMLVIEAMVDSISEDCFTKSGDESELKMTQDDVADMLNTLADKAEKDDDLSDAMDEMDMDIDEALAEMEDSDFELTITVGYQNGTPARLEISFDGTAGDAGDTSFDLLFEYETTDDGKDIRLEVNADGQEVTGKFSVARDGSDASYEGEIDAGADGTYSIEGSESWDGNDVEGSMTVSGGGMAYELKYEGTVAFGMPDDKVKDDGRFDIDTSDADIQDISDLTDSGLPVSIAPTGSDLPAVSAYPAVSAAPANGGGTIAVILPSMDSAYFTTLADSIASEASYYGWSVDILSADFDQAAQMEQLQNAIAMGHDAVIVDPFGGNDQQLEAVCVETGVPCVMLLDEGETADGNVAAVWLDYTYAGADMAYMCPTGNVFVVGSSYAAARPIMPNRGCSTTRPTGSAAIRISFCWESNMHTTWNPRARWWTEPSRHTAWTRLSARIRH